MTKDVVPICDLDLFSAEKPSFSIRELDNLLLRFPLLEEPHINVYYTVMLISEGTGTLKIDNQVIQIDNEIAVVIQPGSINSLALNKDAKGNLIVFSEDFFSLRYNSNLLHQFFLFKRSSRKHLRMETTLFQHIYGLSKLMLSEFLSPKRDQLKILRSFLNIILIELDRNWNLDAQNKERTGHFRRLQRFEELVEEKFTTWKLPSNYAEELCLTANYLNKLCKQELGLTAGEIIRKRICIEAQRLLHFTHLTVNEIAAELNFETPSYFIAFFKKQLGITPEQFRKKNN